MDSLILLGSDCDATRIVYHFLKSDFHFEKVVLENKEERGVMIRRRLKKLGWMKVTGQLVFQTAIRKYIAAFSSKRIEEIKREHGLNTAPIDPAIVINVASVNDESTKAILSGLKAPVVLVNGTRIISKEILRSVSKTFVNTHLGITPSYRGVHGGYWALANNDPQNFGATVHLVDKGIDTGPVLCQATAVPSKADNFITYPYLQLAAVLPCIKKALTMVFSGNVSPVDTAGRQSKLFYHPTAWQYLINRFRGIK